MGCDCKDCRQEIEDGKRMLAFFRELFIKRMTVDSNHHDRRRKDFNQAIFHYEDDDEVDSWNETCEAVGLPRKRYGETYAVWNDMDMNMVLKCFDDAVKDWRRTFCDVEDCKRPK